MAELTHEQARRYLHIGAAELNSAETADLAGHLAVCPECRSYSARLDSLRPELAAVLHTRWDMLKPAADLPCKIAQRARRDNMKRQTLGYASAAIGLIALAVILILFRLVIPRPAIQPTPTLTAPAVTITVTASPPPASPTPARTSTPTHTTKYTSAPVSTPTLTATPTTIYTPKLIAGCVQTTPIAQAPMLWDAYASPDGQWVSYWAASQEAIAQTTDGMPAGVLHFINLQTGEACSRPEIISGQDVSGPGWSEDGQAYFTNALGTFAGLPCQPQPFVQISESTTNDLIGDAPYIPAYDSPDWKYEAKTSEPTIENDLQKFETSITALASGEVVQRVTWLLDTRTGSYAGYSGGEWLSNSQFLIYETIDQGPLIVDVEKGIIPVITDLLGIKDFKSPLEVRLSSPFANPLWNSAGDRYHLLVTGFMRTEADNPDIYLYHPENGTAEILPYHDYWGGNSGLSADREWLMMDARPDTNGHEAHEVWIRKLEDINGKWQLLAGSDIVEYNALWNSDYTQMMLNKEDHLTWQTFPNPNQEQLGCWLTSGYWAIPEYISPDGCLVLAMGNRPGENDYGLFSLDLCQPAPTPPAAPSQTQDFSTLVEAQAAVQFHILVPSFVPQGLPLGKVTTMDYPDGSQVVQIVYAEPLTGDRPDANQEMVFISLTSGGQPVTLESLINPFKEVALDIHTVTVRVQAGYTYWQPSVAAGNSAWLAWNEAGLTIRIALYGNWPQPTEANPHGLDELLAKIAESLE